MHRRRGIFLVEMLTVILMVGIGGTLMAAGLGSMLRSQDRVVEFGNRLARTNDFLRCLKRDARLAKTAALREGADGGPRQILQIGVPPTEISYRFFEHHIERSGGPDGNHAAKLWSSMSAEAGLTHTDRAPGGTGVKITVFWHRTGSKDPEPNRRFDMFVRCADVPDQTQGQENE